MLVRETITNSGEETRLLEDLESGCCSFFFFKNQMGRLEIRSLTLKDQITETLVCAGLIIKCSAYKSALSPD